MFANQLTARLAARLVLPALTLLLAAPLTAQTLPETPDAARARALRHATVEWQALADHLPDLKTAAPATLMEEGDILRARRMPEDSLDFYQAALNRGGDPVMLWNRIGITEMELDQIQLARVCFRRSIALKKKYAEAWNNLGAAESIFGDQRAALTDYSKAVKINRKNALFHANLGASYFSLKDYESARAEYAVALKLDPHILQQGGLGGTMVHVLSSEERGRFAFEMARMAAGAHEEDAMLQWIVKACEGGFNVRYAMNDAKEFAPYRKDPRITVIIQNTESMRAKQLARVDAVPTLDTVR